MSQHLLALETGVRALNETHSLFQKTTGVVIAAFQFGKIPIQLSPVCFDSASKCDGRTSIYPRKEQAKTPNRRRQPALDNPLNPPRTGCLLHYFPKYRYGSRIPPAPRR